MWTSRCPVRGCPVRWAKGSDRLCPEHEAEDQDLMAVAAALLADVAPMVPGLTQAAFGADPPASA
jgi:hypothetical protein